MADSANSDLPTDGVLVAYLDGELDGDERARIEARLAGDARLSARLDALERGGRHVAEAFDALLAAAPNERLDAMLTRVVKERGRKAPLLRRSMAAAAAIALFVAGAVVGYVVPQFTPDEPATVAQEQRPGWRQVVAEYLALTTSDTLAVIPDSPAVLLDELTAVGAKLALDLSLDKLKLPNIQLKRAQLFEFNGKPLAQLSYASKDTGPIVLCIIVNGQADAGLAFEVREGSNIVFWAKDGRGYMLIGKSPRETLEALAGEAAARLS